MAQSLQGDIQGKYIQEWYRGFSQLLSGDKVKNLKSELIRVLDFHLFQSIIMNLDKIKKLKGSEFMVPSDNIGKIDILQEVGALDSHHADTLRQGSIDLFRWRLRNEILQAEGLDAALLTNKERERATAYAAVMNELISNVVQRRSVLVRPIIS